jgi:hypothetical protein
MGNSLTRNRGINPPSLGGLLLGWGLNSLLITLLGALSCRFFIRGEPPNKNAAKPSPGETLRVGVACALRFRGTKALA